MTCVGLRNEQDVENFILFKYFLSFYFFIFFVDGKKMNLRTHKFYVFFGFEDNHEHIIKIRISRVTKRFNTTDMSEKLSTLTYPLRMFLTISKLFVDCQNVTHYY